jgi:PmbA protein
MQNTDTIALLDDLIGKAVSSGADAADALMGVSESLSVGRRMDKPERLERSESIDFGLRVFVGKRQAVVSSTDMRPETLKDLVTRAVAMAHAVPEDEFAGLATGEQLATDFPELDLCDNSEPQAEELIDLARRCEAAALDVDGITNSEGAESSWSRSHITLVASNGFAQRYSRSRFSIGVSPIAGSGDSMERDYDHTTAIHFGDLESPEAIGRSAAEKAVRRMGPRKVETARVPIVFDPRVGSGLLGALAGAITGSAVARGSSYLKDSLGKQILPPGVTIWDDPFRQRGLRSRPFDGEGVQPMKRPLVHDGYLTSWIMDLRSARQLGFTSTGHAARGTGGPPAPSPSNLYFQPGTIGRDDLLRQVGTGLYVTGLMGIGSNMITGDYSQGALGFWIENGELSYPVSEVTIAGNLKDMFLNMTLASDLTHRYGIDAPTLAIEGMTLAGR